MLPSLRWPRPPAPDRPLTRHSEAILRMPAWRRAPLCSDAPRAQRGEPVAEEIATDIAAHRSAFGVNFRASFRGQRSAIIGAQSSPRHKRCRLGRISRIYFVERTLGPTQTTAGARGRRPVAPVSPSLALGLGFVHVGYPEEDSDGQLILNPVPGLNGLFEHRQ